MMGSKRSGTLSSFRASELVDRFRKATQHISCNDLSFGWALMAFEMATKAPEEATTPHQDSSKAIPANTPAACSWTLLESVCIDIARTTLDIPALPETDDRPSLLPTQRARSSLHASSCSVAQVENARIADSTIRVASERKIASRLSFVAARLANSRHDKTWIRSTRGCCIMILETVLIAPATLIEVLFCSKADKLERAPIPSSQSRMASGSLFRASSTSITLSMGLSAFDIFTAAFS
mmetsp:Transcript_1571/g.4572  ORF Transcript_1571/g.4572 Transcript_1571/m.4572 type:complete len:238 (-) Transcript_1571:985-1698(-)